MAAGNSTLCSVEYATESSFGEDVDTVTTARLPTLGMVDLSGLKQPKIPIGASRQYVNEEPQDLVGAMGGSFTLEFMLPGLGSTCAGAIPSSDMATFLGYVIGNVASSAASGTTLTGGTASVPLTTASGTFTAGSMCRIGALGDGDGEGQWYAIGTHSGTSLTLLTALIAAPANGAVLYTAKTIYPSEDTDGATIQSLRFGFRTANQQYIVHGCYPTGWSISGLSTGQQPKITTNWGCSWFEENGGTFPTTTAMQTHSGMTVAAGGLFMNAVGTVTSALRTTVRQFEMSVNYSVAELTGPGGVNAYQSITGCRRTGQSVEITWLEDSEAADTNTASDYWVTDTNSVTNKHILYTLNTRDGASAGLYFPNCKAIGDRPTQETLNGLNVMRWRFKALTGTTTTSDLTTSSFRLGLA